MAGPTPASQQTTTRPASPEVIRDVMAGGIVKTLNGEMEPETLRALAAAGQAYAALEQLTNLEERIRRLEQGQAIMGRVGSTSA